MVKSSCGLTSMITRMGLGWYFRIISFTSIASKTLALVMVMVMVMVMVSYQDQEGGSWAPCYTIPQLFPWLFNRDNRRLDGSNGDRDGDGDGDGDGGRSLSYH